MEELIEQIRNLIIIITGAVIGIWGLVTMILAPDLADMIETWKRSRKEKQNEKSRKIQG